MQNDMEQTIGKHVQTHEDGARAMLRKVTRIGLAATPLSPSADFVHGVRSGPGRRLDDDGVHHLPNPRRMLGRALG